MGIRHKDIKHGDGVIPQRKKIGNAGALPKLNPYPAYKDSGVEWLGKIPAHWEVKRLKYAVTLNPAPTEVRNRGESLEVSFVPMEAIGEYGGLELTTTKLVGEVYTGYTYFREGDVVVAKITPCFENGKGAVATGLVNEIAFGTTELHVLRVKESTDRQFLFYLSMGDAFKRLGEAEMYGAGGQKRVPDSFVRNLMHPLPPLPEQRAIAAFLDRETAKIDALVAKKERLIELLQEKRTALISHAVTKGLDPDAPLKDSGVEWLGEIPAHWEVKRLRVMGTLQTGITLGKRYETPDLVTRPYLRVANVQDGYLALDDIAEIELPAKETRRYELRPNDVLLTEGGDFDKLGRGYLWSGQIPLALHQNHIFVVRPNQQVLSSKFLTVLLTSSYGRAYFTATSKQSTNLASTNSKKLASFPIPIPSLTEQCAIAAFLDRETAQIDALIAKVQEAIDRLKELRTALISAAVTGKIDVREAAA